MNTTGVPVFAATQVSAPTWYHCPAIFSQSFAGVAEATTTNSPFAPYVVFGDFSVSLFTFDVADELGVSVNTSGVTLLQSVPSD